MKIYFVIVFMLFSQLAFSQEKASLTTQDQTENIRVVDAIDVKNLAKESTNKNTIIFTFGVWCGPCRLHLKNAIALKKEYDVELWVLLTDLEGDDWMKRGVDYLLEKDSTINIAVLTDNYGKKKGDKYKRFLKEITPEKFENINGMSKYIVFDKKGEVLMVTTWKDNRKNDWRDKSLMLRDKVIPLLEEKSEKEISLD